MYRHRPDLLSLTFGLLFLAMGLFVLLEPAGSPIGAPVAIAFVLLAGGIGLAGSLALGDVHRRAGARLAAGRPSAALPPPPPGPELTEPLSILDDPLFAPPIGADELDRAYRERFGDDGPADRGSDQDRPGG